MNKLDRWTRQMDLIDKKKVFITELKNKKKKIPFNKLRAMIVPTHQDQKTLQWNMRSQMAFNG